MQIADGFRLTLDKNLNKNDKKVVPLQKKLSRYLAAQQQNSK